MITAEQYRANKANYDEKRAVDRAEALRKRVSRQSPSERALMLEILSPEGLGPGVVERYVNTGELSDEHRSALVAWTQGKYALSAQGWQRTDRPHPHAGGTFVRPPAQPVGVHTSGPSRGLTISEDGAGKGAALPGADQIAMAEHKRRQTEQLEAQKAATKKPSLPLIGLSWRK